MAISDTLGQKLGPLPVWTWGVVVGVGVVAYVWISKASESQTVMQPSDAMLRPVAGDSSALDSAFYARSGASGTYPSEAPAETNLTWLTTVQSVLAGKGYAPLDISNALNRYLNGESLSDSDQRIVNEALTAKGLPPDGAMSQPSLTLDSFARVVRDSTGRIVGVLRNGSTRILSADEYRNIGAPGFAVDDFKPLQPAPAPTPQPSPTPDPAPASAPAPAPSQRTYRVVRGDNLTKIGRRYGVSWQAIYNANRGRIKNPNLIYPGWVLVIP